MPNINLNNLNSGNSPNTISCLNWSHNLNNINNIMKNNNINSNFNNNNLNRINVKNQNRFSNFNYNTYNNTPCSNPLNNMNKNNLNNYYNNSEIDLNSTYSTIDDSVFFSTQNNNNNTHNKGRKFANSANYHQKITHRFPYQQTQQQITFQNEIISPFNLNFNTRLPYSNNSNEESFSLYSNNYINYLTSNNPSLNTNPNSFTYMINY
jgi:hypothetical protein